MKTPTRKRLAIAVVMFMLIAVLIYTVPQAPAPTMQAIGCEDIVKGCAGDGVEVRFDRAPKVMQPFSLVVEIAEAEKVDASFTMAGMEMGFNRYKLVRRADQRWEAEVTLPVCARSRNDWLLLLDVSRDGAHRRIAIAFKAD